MSSETKRQRLFFALWPDETTRARIARLAREMPRKQGRPVAPANLHITLAFIGAIGADMRDCLRERARGVRGEAFSLELTETGCFARAKVLWLGAPTCPEPLGRLVAELQAALAPCGYEPEAGAFRPHVTLFRKAVPAPTGAQFAPIVWPVDRFCLVESRTRAAGPEYIVLERFELTAPGC